MNANRVNIYQSGERVNISGMYEVVGLARQIKGNRAQPLYVGQIFPCFDGVEVCWHLCSPVIEPPLEIIASDVTDTIFYG